MVAKIWTEDSSGKKGEAPGKGGFDVPSGGRIHLQVPGSGGFGDVRDRNIESIKEDIIDGYISEEAAEKDYGVKDIKKLMKK